ncbi:MAG TPA: GNAT family N-acetyltransferase [Candidatus Limnocylindrales bacterium]
MTQLETTWDGLPIAPDDPRGAAIVVRRNGTPGEEFLVLHRHHHGPHFEGDWAWTPPSGARLPDEAVLDGACRELAEEAGLSGVDVRPVDLSGTWAVFAARIDPDTPITLDVEHDRFEWLGREEALARLAPSAVVEAFQRGSKVPLPRLGFRPPTEQDAWPGCPYVRQFRTGPLDNASTITADGEAIGLIRYDSTVDHPEWTDEWTGAVGLDYVIGTAAWTGRGIGPQIIWAYVRDIVVPQHPGVPGILAAPEVSDGRAIRALLKAGFRRLDDDMTQPGGSRHALCVFEPARLTGVSGAL